MAHVMDYCKYHPLQAALNVCTECQIHTCHDCVDEGWRGEQSRCMLCDAETARLDVAPDVVPFWRRIDKSFHYPMTKEVMIFIGIISLLTAVASFLPVPIMAVVNILLAGIMIKYCFNCLSATASGEMEPPDVTTAYQGGVLLILRLLLMLVIACSAVAVVYIKVSAALGSLMTFFLMIAFPAIIIVYAITGKIFEALNPIRLMSLITTIGLPYGLILALLMIMTASVDLLSALVGDKQSLIVLSLQAVISNFYSVVMFHLMGYMIFQYQHKLGTVADNSRAAAEGRPDLLRQLAKIQVLLKEGRWSAVEQCYSEGIKKFSDDDSLNTQYFQWTLSTLPSQTVKFQQLQADSERDISSLHPKLKAAKVIDGYMLHLIESNQTHQLTLNHRRALLVLSDYRPQAPAVRHELAKAYRESGNPKACITLLNGLHKKFPNYYYLIPAYELMVEALNDVPGMEKHVSQCEQLLESLRLRAPVEEETATSGIRKPALDETSDKTAKPEEASDVPEPSAPRELAPIEFKL